ncbi:hypothetical protein AB6D11_03030 [Vibrio splendidus]
MLFFPRFYSEHYLFGVNEYNELLTVLPPGDQMDPASYFSDESTFCEAVELNDPSIPCGVLYLLDAVMAGETTYGLPLFSCTSIDRISESKETSKGLSWVYADVYLLVDQNSKSVHRLRQQLNDPTLSEDKRTSIYEQLEDPSLYRYFLVKKPTESALQVNSLNFDDKFNQLKNDFPQCDDVPGCVNVAILTGSQATKDRKFLPYHFDRSEHAEQWAVINKQVWPDLESLAYIQPASFYHLSAVLVSKIPEDLGTEDWSNPEPMLLIIKDDGDGPKVHSVHSCTLPTRLVPESIDVEVTTDGLSLLHASLTPDNYGADDANDEGIVSSSYSKPPSNGFGQIFVKQDSMITDNTLKVTENTYLMSSNSEPNSDSVTESGLNVTTKMDVSSESTDQQLSGINYQEDPKKIMHKPSVKLLSDNAQHKEHAPESNTTIAENSEDIPSAAIESCDNVTDTLSDVNDLDVNHAATKDLESDKVSDNGSNSNEFEDETHWWAEYLNTHQL